MRRMQAIAAAILWTFWASAAGAGQGERLALAEAPPRASAQQARATLRDAGGREVGQATLTERPGGIRIQMDLRGLPPGVHAFHIHEAGRCDPPDFKSAGGHFNPEGRKHGRKNPQGPHAGDLPNILVGPDGAASVELLARGVTLGTGEHSLFKPGGTSLVIHAGADDDVTDPAGNAGARIACGVIER